MRVQGACDATCGLADCRAPFYDHAGLTRYRLEPPLHQPNELSSEPMGYPGEGAATVSTYPRCGPDVETRIWRPGDVGWVADIIEASWSRWLLVYPREWRTVGQAIPYVHLRAVHECDQPKTDEDREVEALDLEEQMETHDEELDSWRRAGKLGPEPDMPPPLTFGHTHAHDHGICIDPWLADHATVNASLTGVLMHELAHAIAGTFGHDENWIAMCQIIGHDLCPRERKLVRRTMR